MAAILKHHTAQIIPLNRTLVQNAANGWNDPTAMAITFTLIETTKLINVDPRAWLTWGLAQIADHKIIRHYELLRWCFAAKAA